ncbi:MAG: anti-sigma regulatory factor [Sphaerochaetaceae bacterium]|jgi:anti-sigma regulatory factor (Ser/Thr protein kinase)
MNKIYQVSSGDFANAGKVSSALKGTLKQLNLDPKDIKRIIVALYEAEVNVVAHSYGGEIECLIDPQVITIIVSDTGPGIPDLKLAMTEGFSTASEEVREMGFGAGMGLINIKNNCDEMSIDTAKDNPTIIKLVFNIAKGDNDA